MFEKIVLKSSFQGGALTTGELAEALLFYQNIHLILDYGSTKSLFKDIGADSFLSLLSRNNIHATYCEDKLATLTTGTGPIKSYDFVVFSYSGSEKKGIVKGLNMTTRHILEDLGYSEKDSKKIAQKFVKLVPTKKLHSDHFIKGGILNAAREDLEDSDYVNEIIRKGLIKATKNQILSHDLQFHLIFKKKSRPSDFSVISNIDFEDINSQYINLFPKSGKITEASLINNILTARGDMILAKHYGGEFYTSELASEIIQLKYYDILRRINIDKNEIKTFSDIVIPNGRSIKEVINSKDRSFDEFLSFLDTAQKFKECWLARVNPDTNLVKEYLQEVSNKGWLEQTNKKSIRYLLTNIAGLIEPVAGFSLSAADTFFLKGLLSGWKPNHFIDGSLKNFVTKNE